MIIENIITYSWEYSPFPTEDEILETLVECGY